MEAIEINLDDPRALMYEELVEALGQENVDELIARQVNGALTEAYDNREHLKQQAQQG